MPDLSIFHYKRLHHLLLRHGCNVFHHQHAHHPDNTALKRHGHLPLLFSEKRYTEYKYRS